MDSLFWSRTKRFIFLQPFVSLQLINEKVPFLLRGQTDLFLLRKPDFTNTVEPQHYSQLINLFIGVSAAQDCNYVFEPTKSCKTFYISPLDPKHRTIYEYHRVEIDTTKIVSRSAFEFTPLPSKYPHKPTFIRQPRLISQHCFFPPACLQHTSCELCLTSNLTTGCGWCNTLQR